MERTPELSPILNCDTENDTLTGIKEYILLESEENENYLIKFGKSKNKNYLIFQALQKDTLINFFHQTEKNLNDFQNLSKGFKMCDSIDEIYEVIQQIFETKKVYVKREKSSNTINLILKISLLGGNEQEIKFELKQKNYNINEINIELCNKVNSLEKEIKEIKKENSFLKEKIEKLNELMNIQNKQIEELKKWKTSFDIDIEKIHLKKKDDEFMKTINSKIFKEKKEIDFLEKRLKSEPILKNKTIIFKLLYRATEDGNSAESFHKKCDNISGTLAVIKTAKGFRFGGYTEMTWNGHVVNKKDRNGVGFCYSLDLFKIYNNTNEAVNTIRCYTTEGPDFYGGDAYFFDIYFPIDTN